MMNDMTTNLAASVRPSRRRHGRTVARANAPSVRCTERDRWILETLLKFRFGTTTQLARLFFGGSRNAANKRLRRLLDQKRVRVWMRCLAEENVYSLSRAGRATIADEETDTPPSVPRRIDGNLGHLLAINTVRVALATSLPDVDGVLAWWRSDWELRGRTVPQRTIPDALFAVAWPETGERVFALEVEHRTRAPRNLKAKLLRYSAASYRPGGVYGHTNPVVLVVGQNPSWLARYRSAAGSLPFNFTVGFATLADVEEGGVGPVWQTSFGDALLSLRDLANRPYGKEGFAEKFLKDSSHCAASAAHKSPHSDARL